MMLNKEVCKKCWELKSPYPWKWYREDEARWTVGIVQCPVILTDYDDSYPAVISTTEKAPKDCKYKLEHTVLQDENKDKTIVCDKKIKFCEYKGGKIK